MGIRGLFTLIENGIGSDGIYDLAKPGTIQHPIEILVDCNSFMRHLIQLISTKIANKYKNDNLLYPSGEYDIIKDSSSEFHTIFKNAGINLVWILDGPKVFSLNFF